MYESKRAMKNIFSGSEKNMFLFSELVKRDFKQKYKDTYLGILWSLLSPLLLLLVMNLVFKQFFGRNTPHYTIYLFCGNLVFSYFRESTTLGMTTLVSNSAIISKVRISKSIFLLAKNVSCLINFALTLCIFFIFCLFDHITFSWLFLMLLYPTLCMVVFNVGMGAILSALYVFFRDTSYLYTVFLRLLSYCSAIFYKVEDLAPACRKFFLLNPIYVYINYYRMIVLEGCMPSVQYHVLCLFYAVAVAIVGWLLYKKKNDQFMYYF